LISTTIETEEEIEITESAEDKASGDEVKESEAEEAESIETKGIDSSEKSLEIKNEFKDLLDGGADLIELFEFIDKNIENSDSETASYMIAAVSKKSEDERFDFENKFANSEIQQAILDALGGGYEVDMDKLKNTDNENLKDLIEETIARKYRIINVEGFFMPIVDYAAYNMYRDYLTEEMNDYLDIQLDESVRPAILDAGIVIPVEEFLNRIDKSFAYMEKYPDSPRYNEIKQFNSGRLQVYLGGIDNTPVFDISGDIYPEKLSEFQDFALVFEGTALGDVLKDYLNLLEQENYKHTAAIDEFLSEL
jgi:hypothetical protein